MVKFSTAVAFVATVITVLVFNNLYPDKQIALGSGTGIFAFWFGIAALGYWLWGHGGKGKPKGAL